MVDEYSKNINIQDIGLFWQLTIKTIDDLRIVGNENLALEMYIMQLTHLKNIDETRELPPTEYNENKISDEKMIGKKIDEKQFGTNVTKQIKDQLKSTNQIKTNPIKGLKGNVGKTKFEITSFQELINKANIEKEIELKYDLERNVKLVDFNKGTIEMSFNEKLNKNFIKNLSEKLLIWTGERWIISLSKNTDVKSFYERQLEDNSNKIKEFNNSDAAKEFKKAFPDAKLIDIKDED
tara:strand:- start:265 stop:975 length:711 start_codon:yes stop_codon:yes gene_type:complete